MGNNSRRVKSSRAGNALAYITNFQQAIGKEAPYFHVSEPIHNDDELEAVFNNTRMGYARLPGHPDHLRIERWLMRFEDGAHFRVRADGMNAIATALFGATESKKAFNIIQVLPLYGGTLELADAWQNSHWHRLTVKYLYASDPNLLEKLHQAICENTAAVMFEVSGNPTLTFPDVEGIVRVCREHPRGRPITICDDTFLFGLFKPFSWGVDVVVGSGTKYLVGESAYPLGYIGVSKPFNSELPEFWPEANYWANHFGGTLGPFEAWLAGKFSVRDVFTRIRRHSNNAFAVAKFLEHHPCVEKVIYPGLNSYEFHAAADKHMQLINGEPYWGGMISFNLKCDLEMTRRFLYELTNYTHIKFKASLAGPDDMIESPVLLSHRSMPPELRIQCGITDNNLRLSVGRRISPDDTIIALDDTLRQTVLRNKWH